MGLMLGNRQLAMLREMGVRIWQPAPVKTAAHSAPAKPAPVQANSVGAINSVAVRARIHSATGQNGNNPAPRPSAAKPIDGASSAWVTGPACELYTALNSALGAAPHGRWLVLLESSGGNLHGDFDPLQGDAGKLLDNMLRAVQLHTTGGVTVVPLMRGSGHAGGSALDDSLPELVSRLQPTILFIMGRLAAQAALQSSEPLAKLRGRLHQLHGTPTIVSMEPTYLLRNLPDKAKAWEDLCLALGTANSKSV